ncbi:DUF2794 domain-containing protein [Hyphobacterium sp. Y6023]|uniref:DUF2794 domain-containing protein n=2 Tax=Hyphobacterium marinum TaxID=3116574 RepID=A0ABU7LVH0_9PROT|nr:DUF2794 domain-containing protein [Hyphobacterium sp. Y6023]MEE2565552.1 DUF2794 domain-containing protein [Hyphobacterium sp. Y6023]
MTGNAGASRQAHPVMFDRRELDAILRVYGRMVARGDWRDYAIDGLSDRAVFSVYRRTSEYPLYRIEKLPANARRQGAWSILAPGGAILKRGHDLSALLRFFDRKRFSVIG